MSSTPPARSPLWATRYVAGLFTNDSSLTKLPALKIGGKRAVLLTTGLQAGNEAIDVGAVLAMNTGTHIVDIWHI